MKRLTIALVLTILLAAFANAEIKPRVGILTFNHKGISEQDAEALTDMFKSSFFKTDKYTVIDRSEMEAVFEEYEYSQSGCVDDSCVLEVGKMLTAQYMVFGTIYYVSFTKKYSLSIHMKNIETSAMAGSASRQFDAEDDIQKVIEEMTQELIGEGGGDDSTSAGDKKAGSGGGSRAGERKVYTVNGVDFAVRWCPAGTFMMGSPSSEPDRDSDETRHKVTLTKGFWMMETEVTQELYEAVMGNNPSHSYGVGNNYPVYYVDWYDATNFAGRLSDLTGVSFSLPTEAQWEYAARAGTRTAYYWGDDSSESTMKQYAWYEKNADSGSWTTPHADNSGTQPVGTKLANAWGLFDMSGNVYEWCSDWYGDYPSGSVSDPTGPSSGGRRVNRGGSWYSYARSCRSANRVYNNPGLTGYAIGFRLLAAE